MRLYILPLFLVASLVAMVTAAPLTNQKEAAEVEQSDVAVDRAKRAREKIVYGNQQNEARVINKKSDISHVPDQVDLGSQVIVHKEVPVEEDLANRADAARRDFEDQSKIADAMEAAMASVDQHAAQQEEGEQGQQGELAAPAGDDGASSDEMGSEAASTDQELTAEPEEPPVDGQEASTDEQEPHSEELAQEEGTGVVESPDDNSSDDSSDEDVAEVNTDDDNDDDDDEDIKDLLEATGVAQEESGSDVTDQAATSGEDEEEADKAESGELQQLQQEAAVASEGSQRESGPQGNEPQGQQLEDYYRQMYQYMANNFPGSDLSQNMRYDDYYRRRRSLAHKANGARRIKRDLLDDAEYDPALVRYLYTNDNDGIAQDSTSSFASRPSSVLDMGDSLISDSDDYVPLTEADAEDLYSELEDYLQWELQRRAGTQRLRDILGISDSDSDDVIGEELEDDDDNFDRAAASQLGRGGYYGDATMDDLVNVQGDRGLLEGDNPAYSYGLEYAPSNDPSSVELEEKRGAGGEYGLPSLATRKRYFFPFADEPETHWGAFVPEKREGLTDERSTYLENSLPWREETRSPTKREYSEAIQRLQRLAMALSDNRGPYFNEVVQDQPYKK